MDALSMSGGGTMSMAWMPMCGQSRIGAAASFLGLWTVMMAAMMLPSLVPVLWRYRRSAVRAGMLPPALLALLAAGGYFFLWTLLGAAVYPLGAATMMATMHFPALARAEPIAAALVVLLAGAVQLTRWKARHLACCRRQGRSEPLACEPASPAGALTAWRQGLRLGAHCSQCCAGLTAALLVTGIMSWPGMLAATVAINLERLAPAGERIARIVGVVLIGAGLLLMARAIGV
jgi:predicted metal-binding membrane protein